VETVEGDDLRRLLGAAENRPLPEDDLAPAPPPPASALPTEDATPEEAPQGRPGLAWGRSNAAPPSDT
jgi:hypothetical protein